jgi:hypothetical protein
MKTEMRSLLKYALLLFLMACSSRSDIVFSACDELHYLILYKQNNEFEMLYNGLNIVEGNYEWRNDTIFLTYGPEEYLSTDKEGKRHANAVLSRRIVVDRNKKSIHSVDGDGMYFCADIGNSELN